MATERGSARDTELLGSVRNAARVLRAFAGADTELGVTDLSRRLGIGKSTVHRIVSTLTAERLLERGEHRGSYRLGLTLYELGTRGGEHVDLHEAALPVLTTLRHATGETVLVAALDGLEVVTVERLEGPAGAPTVRRAGQRLPAARASTGKVLLAALAPDELALRLEGWQPAPATARTIVTRDRLLAELADVASRGFAVDDEEDHAGVVSVAAPIRGWDGEVMAAMSVVGDANRMRGPVLRHHTVLLLESAAAASRRLGHREPHVRTSRVAR
jgi:IclR family transcriptional regulator, KDG regulon repressor